MNMTKHLSILVALVALLVTACELRTPPFVGPSDRPDNGGSGTVTPSEPLTDTIGWNVPIEALTVSEARDLCASLESGETTTEKYYVMGFVKKFTNAHADGISTYGNALFYMEEVKGANSSNDFYAFQVYGPGGNKITNPDMVAIGDFVVIYGQLTNYNGTYETVGKGAAYIWKSTNPLCLPQPENVTLLDVALDVSSDLTPFGIANVQGADQTWKYLGGKSGRLVQMNPAGVFNEDWLISPALNVAKITEASLSFEHKIAGELSEDEQSHYTVLVSADYDGNVENVNNATWLELTGVNYNATAFVSSNVLSFPVEVLGNQCYVAWRYNGGDKAWSLRNLKVEGLKVP